MDIPFFGHRFMALPEGALFWRERRALILADLHLEKASWFAARAGQMLPPYDSAATLAGVARLVAQCDPAEIWCLGDSFHDDDGPCRLAPVERQRLEAIGRGRRWTWITGNHDPGVAALAFGETAPEMVLDGLVLRHEALAGEVVPELSGHFHPKWRVQVHGRTLSRRCFVLGGNRLILPAFGALTGGLDARAPALSALAGPVGEAIVALDGHLLRFALHARRNVS